MIFSNVDFPDPFRPEIASVRPPLRSKEMSEKTGLLLKSFRRPATVILMSVMAVSPYHREFTGVFLAVHSENVHIHTPGDLSAEAVGAVPFRHLDHRG